MDNLIGKRLDGRYSIEGLVGVGGMANVYRGVMQGAKNNAGNIRAGNIGKEPTPMLVKLAQNFLPVSA